MNLDGLCGNSEIANPLPQSDQLISIDLPVGTGVRAKNLDVDVRTIQTSMNKVPVLHGGPRVALEVDGKCGPKTNKAITDFQFKQFEFKGTDGLIEPGKQTIVRINQVLFSNLPVNPVTNQEIKTKLVSHLDLVHRATHAAQTNCMLAMAPAGGLDLGRGTAISRLDRHFALNTLSGATREKAIRDVLGVFQMYSSVLLMPGALGAGAFEADPTGDPRIAFTFSNGFFRQGEFDKRRGIPLDRIFLGRRAFFALKDSEFCAFIMQHEMAHFVGFPGGEFIPDNGRGWFTDEGIAKLSAEKRLRNADSYATFATECRTGSQAKPPYVQASATSR